MSNNKLDKVSPDKRAKVELAANYMQQFLETLGANMSDPNLQDTPIRVAKMFACELLTGETDAPPELVSFPTPGVRNELVVEKNLPVRSLCSHHLLPINGMAHVAAFYEGGKDGANLPGLSKYGRVVNYFSRRFQLQERLGAQIADYIIDNTEAKMVIVRIVARHYCMIQRGIMTENSMTTTTAIRVSSRAVWEPTALFTPPFIVEQFNAQIRDA